MSDLHAGVRSTRFVAHHPKNLIVDRKPGRCIVMGDPHSNDRDAKEEIALASLDLESVRSAHDRRLAPQSRRGTDPTFGSLPRAESSQNHDRIIGIRAADAPSIASQYEWATCPHRGRTPFRRLRLRSSTGTVDFCRFRATIGALESPNHTCGTELEDRPNLVGDRFCQ